MFKFKIVSPVLPESVPNGEGNKFVYNTLMLESRAVLNIGIEKGKFFGISWTEIFFKSNTHTLCYLRIWTQNSFTGPADRMTLVISVL